MDKIWKRGDVGPDGRFFWKKAATYAGGIRWVDGAEFKRLSEQSYANNKALKIADPVKVKASAASWRARNVEKTKADWKAWYAANAEEARKKRRARALADPEKGRAAAKRWRQRNPEKGVEQVRLYRARAKAKGPGFEMLERLRGRIRTALGRAATNVKRPSRARDRLSVKFLIWLARRNGVEADIKRMQIDHVMPVWWWRTHKSPEEFELVNAPENVRWLTARENASKGGNVPSEEDVKAHAALVSEWRNSFSSGVKAA